MLNARKIETAKERRRHPRISTLNVVKYTLYDEKKIKINQGKGLTINLSQTGTLLQTKHKITGAYIILMAIDLDNNKVKVNGKVITSRSCSKTGTYLTGIEFVGKRDKQVKAIVAFVKIYQRKKYIAESRLSSVN